jgi:hypothetical protein
VVLARRLRDDGSVELVAVTLWPDLDAIVDAFGENWRQGSTVPGIEGLLHDSTTDHFEVITAGWEEMTATTGPA